MLNLGGVLILLFQFSTPNNNSKFTYTFSNSTDISTFCSVNETLSDIDLDPGTIKIGEFYEDNEYVQYSSIFKFSFPTFNTNNIQSATFTISKSSGSISSLNVYYAIGDVSFSNTSWTYFNSASLQGNSYSISIKDIMTSAISTYSENVIYLKLSNPYACGYLIGDSNYSLPKVVLYTSETPTSNTYGCATQYYYVNDRDYTGHYGCHEYYPFNCFGYAIDIWDLVYMSRYMNILSITTNEEIINDMIPMMINVSKNVYDVNMRQIDSYDSPIFPFERRIAFRKALNYGDCHFMRETSDGRWAEKKRDIGDTRICNYGETPETINWIINNNQQIYDSDIFYFAVNNNGGHQNYVKF